MEKNSAMLAARSNPPSAAASLAGKVRRFTAFSRHNSMNPLDIAVFYFIGFLILALYSLIPTPYALRRPGTDTIHCILMAHLHQSTGHRRFIFRTFPFLPAPLRPETCRLTLTPVP
jgi:hypothetical protein